MEMLVKDSFNTLSNAQFEILKMFSKPMNNKDLTELKQLLKDFLSKRISAHHLIAESGVRNWCEASDTNSLLDLSICLSIVMSRNTSTAPVILSFKVIGAIVTATGNLVLSGLT